MKITPEEEAINYIDENWEEPLNSVDITLIRNAVRIALKKQAKKYNKEKKEMTDHYNIIINKLNEKNK